MRELLIFLILSEEEFVARWIDLAISKKDVNLLTLIICTQTNQALQKVKEIYNAQSKKSMSSKIDGLTSNIFHKRNINKFLLGLLEAKRLSDEQQIDLDLVNKDVNHIIDASKSKKQLNKETYIEIFTHRSFEHLSIVASTFEQKSESKQTLIDVVKSVWKESSETGYAIIVILYFATRRYELFSNCLAQAIHEPGPNFVMFLRIVVERCEIDLANIIQVYGKNALKNFVELNIKSKDEYAAELVNKLCGF